uniref:RCC1 domain-containing protein n=1 Tax=Candidatus Electronema sp. TaxID=2698783 RepID=UPI0040568C7F
MKNICLRALLAAFAFFCMEHAAEAATLLVPSQYATPNAAAAAAKDGDTVLIEAGDYTGTGIVATWSQSNLTIRGINGRPHMNAAGVTISNGKGIWVIGGSNVLVENIEFSNAEVPSDNGAGIRYEGTGSLLVRNCYFHNNENAILTGNNGTEEITLEYCEFRDHKTPTLLGHNIYIGSGAKFTMIGSHSHGAHRGHNVKTRARENYILYNRIADSDNLEDKGSSYLVDISQGGLTYMIGNEFRQLQKTENPSAIGYSKEGNKHPQQVLYFINNTVVNDKLIGDSTALDLGASTSGKIVNNIFDSFKVKVAGTFTGEYTNNIDNATFVDRDSMNYRLQSGSSGINTGINAGVGDGFSLAPTQEYIHHLQTAARPSDGQLDVGAFEFTTETVPSHTLSASVTGSGTVTSSPAGISCGSDCSESYSSGQSVTLTASPAAGSAFTGWGGACSGAASECVVSMTEDLSVTAAFDTSVTPPTPTAAVITAGSTHTAALLSDGSLWAWGSNMYTQLGDGTTDDRVSPVRIGTDNNWQSLSSTSIHSVAVKQDGTLWAWGDNSDGQLGDGTQLSRSAPVRIGSAADWKMAAAGGILSAAIKNDGSLWAWGYFTGQYGIGSAAPLRIGAENTWQFVSAGGGHTLAVKSDGSLWGWGSNGWGRLGDGTTEHRPDPVRIGDENSWKFVSAGGTHSLGIKTDGSLWAWGRNYEGQLGDGSNTERHAPVQISGSGWKTAAAGNEHSAAVRNDGTLWTWGTNTYGQLGDGTQTDRNSPVQVGSESSWQAVAIGWAHTVALKNDGTIWAWGYTTLPECLATAQRRTAWFLCRLSSLPRMTATKMAWTMLGSCITSAA